MLTISIRAVILYLVSTLAVRIMGKRQVGQLQPYEFVLALMIADLAASPMENVETPLLYGVTPILALLCLHALFTMADVKWPRFRRLLCAAPSVVIRRGEIQQREMEKLNYTLTDLAEEVRSQGILDLAQVETAILETSGKLSVFPRARFAPLTRQDAAVHAREERIPLAMVMDGRVQGDNLARIGKDEAWLLEKLRRAGTESFEEVFFASLSGEGKLFVQPCKGGGGSALLSVMEGVEAEKLL